MGRTFLKSLLMAGCFVQLLVLNTAFAKKVKVEWEEIDGATRYDLEIQIDGKKILSKRLSGLSWHGDVPFGAYVYRIRGVEEDGTPGEWSESLALAVMPPAPYTKLPEDGAKMDFFTNNIDTVLKWERVPHVNKYYIKLLKDDAPFMKKLIAGTTLTLGALPAGKYTWTVRAIVEERGRTPASVRGKRWQSQGNEATFNISYKTLEKPAVEFPVGSLAPARDGKVKLRWRRVYGAEAYEVYIVSVDPKTRKPASKAPLKWYRTRDNSFVVRVGKDGSYHWGVRALANFTGDQESAVANTSVPQAVGGDSVAQFNTDSSLLLMKDSSSISVMGMILPYSYSYSSQNAQGKTNSAAIGGGLNGTYWITRHWGASAAWDYSSFQVNGQSFDRNNFSASGEYRFCFDSYGVWCLTPHLGPGLREYNGLVPIGVGSNTVYLDNNIFVFGPEMGFRFTYKLSDPIQLAFIANYFVPVSLVSGASGGKISGGPSYRNLDLGIQGSYWFNNQWGVNAGIVIDQRSLSYLPSGSTTTTQIYTDATFFMRASPIVLRITDCIRVRRL